MSILGVVRTYRSLKRLRYIVQVITRHGLGSYVERLHLARFVPVRFSFRSASKREEIPTPRIVAQILKDLGPTTVKLGQMLSTRPDLLPDNYRSEFALLQDKTDPFPATLAKKTIERELGRPVNELFASFDDSPIASASIAQVHKAELIDGTPVVVKVRRPDIEETLKADMDLLRAMADLTDRYIPEVKAVRPKILVEEFARSIRKELDFVSEAAYTARFYKEFRNDPRIKTPKVYWELTSTSVLTIGRLKGVKISETTTGLSGNRTLAENISSLFMKQYFELGVFHSDPHPGNILIDPEGTVGLIDFGLVGHMSDDLREKLITSLIALNWKDFDTIIDVCSEIGATSPDTDLQVFKNDLMEIVDRYLGIPMSRIDIRSLFSDMMYTARQNHVVLPRNLILLAKSMATISGIVRELDPDYNLAEKVGEHAHALVEERLKPGNLLSKTATGTWHFLRLFNALPGEIGQIIRKLRSGLLEIAFRHEGLEQPVAELDKVGNRLSLSVILASIVVASAVILNAKLSPLVPGTDFSILGLAGYCFAAILGIWLVIAILRSGRL